MSRVNPYRPPCEVEETRTILDAVWGFLDSERGSRICSRIFWVAAACSFGNAFLCVFTNPSPAAITYHYASGIICVLFAVERSPR